MKIKFSLFAIFVFSFLLSACGGGGGGNGDVSRNPGGTPQPAGTVSGISQLGLIKNANVSVYDYTGCVPGTQIASSTTDSNGSYSLSITHPDGPVLIAVGFKSGTYVEEASLQNENLTLPTDGLYAVANYSSGKSLSASTTFWTNVATAIATYQATQGTACAKAIDNANNEINSITGINILSTEPADITSLQNTSATMTDSIKYGMYSGGISQYTYNQALNATPVDSQQAVYNSIRFADIAYQDALFDGKLDGMGSSGGLSFGTIPLSPKVYRYEIARGMLQMADNPNNQTGLKSSDIFYAAKSFNDSTDPLFNGAAVTPFALNPPAFSPVTMTGTTSSATNSAQLAVGSAGVTMTGTATSTIGITETQLLVDGTVVDSVSGGDFSFNLLPTDYTTGTHSVAIRAFDNAGTSSDYAYQLMVESPTLSINMTSGTSGPTLGNSTTPANWCDMPFTYSSEGTITVTSNQPLQGTTTFPAATNKLAYVEINLTQAYPAYQTVTLILQDQYGFKQSVTKNVSLTNGTQTTVFANILTCYVN